MKRLSIAIRPADLTDWSAIEHIYRSGIRTGNATFQTEVEIPDGSTWFNGKLSGSIFVAADDYRIVGWTALSKVSNRPVYAGVAEVSVYVAPVVWGRGVGTALMENMVRESEMNSIWTLQAGIFPENEVSIRLHKRFGFRVVGMREKLGQMNGVWRDVILLERRSSTT
jgi:phosphinothricin acetyltransferase